MIVTKYKFNPNTYANLLPEFNSEFTNYTTSDVNNDDGTVTRTIESNSLPTKMRFGNKWVDDNYDNEQKPRRDSLLEVLSADMSSISSASAMFRGCSNVTSVDLSNVSNTTDFAAMFEGCSSLTSLNVSNWNTSKVTNMKWMFYDCSSLTSLDVSNWDTSKVTTLYCIFLNCKSLSSLDVSNWNTSQVTNMHGVFAFCTSLTQLDVSNWDVSNATDMEGMFQGCSKLTSLDLSNWDTSKVSSMLETFYNCSSLTSLDLSNWNTSGVINMEGVFKNCKSLTSLDISNWNSSNVDTILAIFLGCSSLRKIKMINATIPQLIEELPTRASSSVGYLFSPTPIPNEKNWNTIITYTGYNITIKTSQPLGKNDKLYWSSSNNRFEIDRNGVVEVPTVEGNIVDLPRLYQKDFSTINISTDNIKPSKIAIEYKDINNN